MQLQHFLCAQAVEHWVECCRKKKLLK